MRNTKTGNGFAAAKALPQQEGPVESGGPLVVNVNPSHLRLSALKTEKPSFTVNHPGKQAHAGIWTDQHHPAQVKPCHRHRSSGGLHPSFPTQLHSSWVALSLPPLCAFTFSHWYE
jgi:hypothetical protein